MHSRRAILTYHSVDDSGSVISVRRENFLDQMQALAGAKVVRLSELLSVPGPAVALTFDDGFRNFAEVAAPILSRHGFPATIFLVTDHCGGYNDWPSGALEVPRLPLMDWATIQEMSRGGFEFGSHSATHPDLARLDEDTARHEILSSKQRIEDVTGRAVKAFAYPYGSMTTATRNIVAENFDLGCSTRMGWVSAASDAAALERIDVYYLSHSYLWQRLFGTPARWYLGLRGALREWKHPQS